MLTKDKNNWNNFPDIKVGDKIRVTWNERYYGLQDDGEAYKDGDKLLVKFGDYHFTPDNLRSNPNIIRTEIIK